MMSISGTYSDASSTSKSNIISWNSVCMSVSELCTFSEPINFGNKHILNFFRLAT